MKKSRPFIIISLSLLILVFVSIVLYIGHKVYYNTSNLYPGYESTKPDTSLLKKYNLDYDDFCKTYKIENINITSSYLGKDFTGDYIYAKNCTTKEHNTVILAPGINTNRYSMYPLAKFFLDNGYNVITYDEICCGENTAAHTSFGYYESFDLEDMISYAKDYTQDSKLIVYGTSLGASAVGIALDNDIMKEYVDYAILDSPMTNLYDVVQNKIYRENKFLPRKMIAFYGSIVSKLRIGVSFSEIDTCNHASNTNTPILIFNSTGDTFTPEYMGVKIYKLIPEGVKKQLYTSEDSEHGEIFLDYPEEYEEAILDFIS